MPLNHSIEHPIEPDSAPRAVTSAPAEEITMSVAANLCSTAKAADPVSYTHLTLPTILLV